ncbi:hypothetical protein EYZ11_006106 [Aspergillus tanneri]|uniref:Carbohydrate-binding module family 96 domain-containing protein n=1 Tax=Aspergillus tanneri TaxID=1220188 RepID=A0A4S3JGA2_9EURO|nr:uncharacterized protein ATNIH1004_003931 [Aspergillus tanneri]KAA8648048.1 hypothetical protein ATNIH1004_003931 [Aspergillus tanneri]THC94409.1 hypothetical protein EYZ11_006106 [Aspergillus tanneri]
MHLSHILTLSLTTTVLGSVISRPAIKDSTILRSTVSCVNCPDKNCNKCTLGHEKTLKANTGGHAYLRWLVGFCLPESLSSTSVTKCNVQFPGFTQHGGYPAPVNVTVSRAVSSKWNEEDVTAGNAPDEDNVSTSVVNVPAYSNLEALDVTEACKRADENGEFSIYVGTQSGTMEVWSLDSGNAAILHVTTE